MEAPDHVEQLDGAVLKRKRVEEGNVDINAKPASKATGKPVLNTRALRSVLKGGCFVNTCTALQETCLNVAGMASISLLMAVRSCACSFRRASRPKLCTALVSTLHGCMNRSLLT